MIYGIYTVFDKLAGEYGPLFQAVNNLVALRNFKAIMKNVPESEEEYSLWNLGEYDSETSKIILKEKSVEIKHGGEK